MKLSKATLLIFTLLKLYNGHNYFTVNGACPSKPVYICVESNILVKCLCYALEKCQKVINISYNQCVAEGHYIDLERNCCQGQIKLKKNKEEIETIQQYLIEEISKFELPPSDLPPPPIIPDLLPKDTENNTHLDSSVDSGTQGGHETLNSQGLTFQDNKRVNTEIINLHTNGQLGDEEGDEEEDDDDDDDKYPASGHSNVGDEADVYDVEPQNDDMQTNQNRDSIRLNNFKNAKQTPDKQTDEKMSDGQPTSRIAKLRKLPHPSNFNKPSHPPLNIKAPAQHTSDDSARDNSLKREPLNSKPYTDSSREMSTSGSQVEQLSTYSQRREIYKNTYKQNYALPATRVEHHRYPQNYADIMTKNNYTARIFSPKQRGPDKN
jgi:hypothetical protein